MIASLFRPEGKEEPWLLIWGNGIEILEPTPDLEALMPAPDNGAKVVAEMVDGKWIVQRRVRAYEVEYYSLDARHGGSAGSRSQY